MKHLLAITSLLFSLSTIAAPATGWAKTEGSKAEGPKTEWPKAEWNEWFAFTNNEGGIFSVYHEVCNEKDTSYFVQSQRWTREEGFLNEESVGSSASKTEGSDLGKFLRPIFFNTRVLFQKKETITDAIFKISSLTGTNNPKSTQYANKSKVSKKIESPTFEVSLKTKSKEKTLDHIKKQIQIDFILGSHFSIWLRDIGNKKSAEISFLVETQVNDGFPIRKAKATPLPCSDICKKGKGSVWKVILSETPTSIAEIHWWVDDRGATQKVLFPKSGILMVPISAEKAKQWIEKNDS